MKPFSRLLGEAAPGREPEPELARHLLSEAAPGEVLAHRPARLALPEQRARSRWSSARGARTAARAVRRSASIRGDASSYSSGTRKRSASHSIAPDEVEVLGFPDERDDVAALAAAEAVEELVDGVHGEARRPLLVERASPLYREPEARRSCVRPDTTSTMSAAARTSRTEESLIRAIRLRLLPAHVVLPARSED